MRVTDKMVFDSASRSTARARDAHHTALGRVATGVKVQHPGDDPAGAGRALAHSARATALNAVEGAARNAADEIDTAEAALGALSDLVANARELAVQLSNDTYSEANRAAAASDVDGMFRQAISLLNTRHGDRYVFGGTQDGQAPFDAAGAYLGSLDVRQVAIAPGVMQAASVRGDEIAMGAGGGADLLGTLQALSAALAANDPASIRAALNPLDEVTQQVSSGRARLGASHAVFTATADHARAGRDSEIAAYNGIVEADPIAAATELALAERALEAALSAAARSFKISLLDKL